MFKFVYFDLDRDLNIDPIIDQFDIQVEYFDDGAVFFGESKVQLMEFLMEVEYETSGQYPSDDDIETITELITED
jgi:hypothetical protein